MSTFRVLVLLGSLRARSVNRQLAEAAVASAPDGIVATVYEGLAELPHYDEDIDTDASRPAAVEHFYDQLRASDAVLVVTPEYNGTMSSVVKNAIDWASRPSRRGPIAGLPAAAVGATFGAHGGVWSQQEARRALSIAGARVVEEPVVAVGHAQERFAETPPADDDALRADLALLLENLRAVVQSSRLRRSGTRILREAQ